MQFEGQTKGKLGTPSARNVVDSIVSEKLEFYLEENKEVAVNKIVLVTRFCSFKFIPPLN